MASNADLTKEILEINPAESTEGLTNAELAAVLKALRAPLDTAAQVAQVDPAAQVANVKFTVVKGKAITSKRGILSGGDSVAAGDLAGGLDSLDALEASGYIEQA